MVIGECVRVHRWQLEQQNEISSLWSEDQSVSGMCIESIIANDDNGSYP